MVSRETADLPEAPEPPGVLAERFPGAAEGLVRYAAVLASDGVARGLIGPREVPRLWDRHLLNCAALEELLPEGTEVADIGSGAGLPGLVLALVRPDLRVTLVEAMLRRSTFLEETVALLGLENVVVVRARVEELPKGTRFAVVTSRAVAPLPKLAAWCAPVLASQGRMLAMKGDRAEEELAEAAGALKKLKLDSGRIVRVGDGLVSPPTTVVEIRGPMRANPAKKRARRTTGADGRTGAGRSLGRSSGRRAR